MLAHLSESNRGPTAETWAHQTEWAVAAAESLAAGVGGGQLEPLPLARLRSAAQFGAWKEYFLSIAERAAHGGEVDRAAKLVHLASKIDDVARLSEQAARQMAAEAAAERPYVDPSDAYLTGTNPIGTDVDQADAESDQADAESMGGTDDEGGGLFKGRRRPPTSEDP